MNKSIIIASFAFQVKEHWLLPTAKETWVGTKVIIDQVVREFAGGF